MSLSVAETVDDTRKKEEPPDTAERGLLDHDELATTPNSPLPYRAGRRTSSAPLRGLLAYHLRETRCGLRFHSGPARQSSPSGSKISPAGRVGTLGARAARCAAVRRLQNLCSAPW
jgi:hypothetical protein